MQSLLFATSITNCHNSKLMDKSNEFRSTVIVFIIANINAHESIFFAQ